MSEKKYALLIASFDYEDPYFRCLEAPRQDVEALSRILLEPSIGGFFDVKTLLNEPREKLILAIEEFFDDRDREDLLLLYFSGHGIKDEDGRLYYASKNTLHKRLVSTGLAAYQVNDLIGRSRSRRKILLLDCCYSGAFSRAFLAKGTATVGVMEEFKQGQGLVTLTASDAFQYSFEGEEITGGGKYSVFTRSLIEGIETGKADEDGDEWIGLDELYNYVYGRVRAENPNQSPRISGDVEGRIIVARNPQPPPPAELPLRMQDAIESPIPEVREGIVRTLDLYLRSRNKGLAVSAREALQGLTEDDSRRVASAAQKCLDTFDEARRREAAEREGKEKEEQARAEAERRGQQEAERARREAAEREGKEKEEQARAEAERRAQQEAELARWEAEAQVGTAEIASGIPESAEEQPVSSWGSIRYDRTQQIKQLLIIAGVFFVGVFVVIYVQKMNAPQPFTSQYVAPTPETRCASGDAKSCFDLAVMYDSGTGVSKDVSRAAQLYKQACDGGLAVGCSKLGSMYDSGTGVSRDQTRAAELYKQACDGGNTAGCSNLGVLYDTGAGVSKDHSRAAQLYKQGCDGGNALGCSRLGLMYYFGTGVPKNQGRAAQLYKQGCDGGNALGCSRLGLMYDFGTGVSKDQGLAAQLYRQACKGGDAGGCTSLGLMYDFGTGVPKDQGHAAQLYKQGCDGGDGGGCSSLGDMYDNGKGVSRDSARAEQFYKQGCDRGNAGGCTSLGLMRWEWEDKAAALRLWKKACDLGDENGCTNFKDRSKTP